MLKVLKGATAPTRGSKYSSCIDLYANEDVIIGAGETKIVPLGVKIDLESLNNKIRKTSIMKYGYGEYDSVWGGIYNEFYKSHCLELKCRSSLPLKKGLIIANGVGEIDLDYPDEIGIILHNPICELQENQTDALCQVEYHETTIIKGDRVAQIRLVEHKSYLFGVESEDERSGGFGSTDNDN